MTSIATTGSVAASMLRRVCVSGDVCNYHRTGKTEIYFFSLLHGFFGVDWFVLAKGNGAYIAVGVLKCLTLGGFGVWWLVDWIRVLCNGFPDGNGVALAGWP
jgi:hypothetical protein